MLHKGTPYTYLCLFAAGDQGEPELLLVKRLLLNKWADGRPSSPIIPQWAGQWGVVCAQPKDQRPIAEIAYAALFTQTGIDLKDPSVSARYQVIRAESKTLQDSDYNPVQVLYLVCEPAGLQALQVDAQSNIQRQNVLDGVLETTALKRLSEAARLIGPVVPPKDGWKGFVIANYYDGSPPLLNPPIDARAQVLGECSARKPVGFSLVIGCLPDAQGTPPPPPAPPRLNRLEVYGAEQQKETGLYYQAWDADQMVRVLAVTDPDTPDVHARIGWSGGEPDFSGAPNLRNVSLATLTNVGKPTKVSAALNDKHLSIQVAVVPNLVRLDVSNALSEGDSKWALDPEDEAPVVVRAVAQPDTEAAYKQLAWTGGEIDPAHPYDRRLVRASDIDLVTGSLPVDVSIQLG